jgi:hypothetical protein
MTVKTYNPSVPGLRVGDWVFSPNHGESVRILDVETAWNHTVCQRQRMDMGLVEEIHALPDPPYFAACPNPLLIANEMLTGARTECWTPRKMD